MSEPSVIWDGLLLRCQHRISLYSNVMSITGPILRGLRWFLGDCIMRFPSLRRLIRLPFLASVLARQTRGQESSSGRLIMRLGRTSGNARS